MLGALALAASPPSAAIGSVRTTACTDIPALVNGGFEDFSNPDNGGVANNKPTTNGYGWWHGYPYGGSGSVPGPNQILFLKTGDPAVPSNYLTGWRTSDPNYMVELQQQLTTYTESVDSTGVTFGPFSPSRSGVATTSTWQESGYWDKYGPQPAQGTYWAELNALSDQALYQDITVASGDQLFWSLKHRGRTENNEEMKVSIGPVGSLTQQTTIYKYAPTNADRFVGYPVYNSTYAPVSQIVTPLNSGWNRYEGAYTSATTGPLRFEFRAVGGTPYGNAFGNLLDDIQFTIFLACPATRALHVGQSVSIDVGQAPMSYGIRQSLSGVANSTAPAGEIQTSGDIVTFTPSSAGVFTADYTVAMNFGGQTYTKSALLTYNVSAAPTPPPSPSNPTPPPTTSTPSPTPPTPPTPVAVGRPSLTGQLSPGSIATCTAPEFTPAPDTVAVTLSLGDTSLASGQTSVSARIPASASTGQEVNCSARASISNSETTVTASAPVPAVPRHCSASAPTRAVFFTQLDFALSRAAKAQLRRLNAKDCAIWVTGYVEPTRRFSNDESLSRARARSVASFLHKQGATITSITAGRRELQASCKPAANRCVVVRVETTS